MQMPNFRKTLFPLFTILLLLSSCSSQKEQLYNPKEVQQLSYKLGININNQNKNDHKYMPLYAECSLWIGVPYRYGGTTRRGVDCSGLTNHVYKKVYKKKLARSSEEMAKKNVNKISKSSLRPGDLVFFNTTKKKKQINHVGIILKDGYFIHSSTSKGVMVSHINETYFQETWVMAGRVQ